METGTVFVSISPHGAVKLCVNNEQVGYIEEIEFAAVASQPLRNIRVKFISTAAIAPGEEKNKILEKLHYYRELLEQCPQVKVYDEVETLPYMMALRPSSIPPG